MQWTGEQATEVPWFHVESAVMGHGGCSPYGNCACEWRWKAPGLAGLCRYRLLARYQLHHQFHRRKQRGQRCCSAYGWPCSQDKGNTRILLLQFEMLGSKIFLRQPNSKTRACESMKNELPLFNFSAFRFVLIRLYASFWSLVVHLYHFDVKIMLKFSTKVVCLKFNLSLNHPSDFSLARSCQICMLVNLRFRKNWSLTTWSFFEGKNNY